MRLNALMERVHTAYPDEFTREYWDPAAQRVCAGSGDTLAEFIVRELAETYDETASDEQQIAEAVRVLRRASEQVTTVARALGYVRTESTTGKRVLALRLFHGRQRPDEMLEDWGIDGPLLEIDYLHVTYFCHFRIGIHDGASEVWLENWEHEKKDGVLVDDLFHYNGVFYGDWHVCLVPALEVAGKLDPNKAVFPRHRHWDDIPQDTARRYEPSIPSPQNT